MTKPELGQVLELLRLKKEAQRMYDDIDARIADFFQKHGEGRFDYDLSACQGDYADLVDDASYLKFEITDNIAKLELGEDVWKSVAFKPLSFDIRPLKRCPASLK